MQLKAHCNDYRSGAFFALLEQRRIDLEYLTIKQAAEKWGISERRIQVLCREKRIEGVKRFGRAWAIPEDAEKPVDARVTTGEYRNWRKKS